MTYIFRANAVRLRNTFHTWFPSQPFEVANKIKDPLGVGAKSIGGTRERVAEPRMPSGEANEGREGEKGGCNSKQMTWTGAETAPTTLMLSIFIHSGTYGQVGAQRGRARPG
jgi:hypothetical protein